MGKPQLILALELPCVSLLPGQLVISFLKYLTVRQFLGFESGGCSTLGVFNLMLIKLSHIQDWEK